LQSEEQMSQTLGDHVIATETRQPHEAPKKKAKFRQSSECPEKVVPATVHGFLVQVTIATRACLLKPHGRLIFFADVIFKLLSVVL